LVGHLETSDERNKHQLDLRLRLPEAAAVYQASIPQCFAAKKKNVVQEELEEVFKRQSSIHSKLTENGDNHKCLRPATGAFTYYIPSIALEMKFFHDLQRDPKANTSHDSLDD
jgi:hypothetical protein